jgi:enterochelin esterase-like enzyme
MPSTRFSPALFSLFAVCFLLTGAAPRQQNTDSKPANGLSENQIISSDALGYDLQYRVYVPDGIESMENVPVTFVTDGQWYIDSGELPGLMDNMIQKGEIQPAIAVFVDNRDPHDLSNNRRNAQFFCNEQYVSFYRDELIPSIESEYPVGTSRDSRTILGLSFGGLNSACFGLLASDVFKGIAMQSPAMHPVSTIHNQYQDAEDLDIKIFLTSGTERDNEAATRRLRDVLEAKEFELQYHEVPFGHNWKNWQPLLDDFLLFYYGDVSSG